ncbi:MAG: zf-HC2 domain-containing protein [Acidobacteria bacterium]|nr:zf-HC2 domain-containing protein [Acidobacteriota bacterium]
MNCEHCQDLISVFLDNELDQPSADRLREHLAVCDECSRVCEDLAMIMDVCRLDEDEAAMPPNPQALWCRINNVIESEVQAEILKEHKEQEKAAAAAESGWLPRRWNFSFMQLASAVVGIALISSLVTLIAIRNYGAPAGSDLSSNTPPTLFEKILGKVGLMETPEQKRSRVLKEREAAIDYWNKRVEARRAQWNTTLRDAFDRNLHEIDQAVDEYTEILQENPQDELSSEMLDSALDEKMELLRQFSEL